MQNDKIFPKDWKEVIQRKKVIFYNTSVANLLQGKEKHIEKMQWVFQVFQKHPEVVLWWRPHPLELSTIQSMLPELEKRYVQMRRQYQEEHVGILDESADLHRAIAVSDAYYGDGGSVVQLYKLTKKPMLFGNDTIFRKLCEHQLEVTDFIEYKGNLWCISGIYNYLFEIDAENKNVVKSLRLPIGYPFSSFMIKYMFHVDDEIILVPGKGTNILKYHIVTGQFSFITTIDNILSLFASIYCEDHHTIYGVTGNDNFVYKYNLLTDTYNKKSVGDKKNCYIGIKKVGSQFVITQLYNEKIVLWNEENDEIEEIDGFPQGYDVKYPQYPFTDIVLSDDKMLLFPQYANMILEIDVRNKKIVRGNDNYLPYDYDNGMVYSCAKNIGNDIIAYAQYTNMWVKYNYGSKSIEELHIQMPKEQWDYLHQQNILEMEYDKEDSFCEVENQYFFTLERFLNGIQEYDEVENNCIEGQCGYEIYEQIQGEL